MERRLAELDDLEAEATWVAVTLDDFPALWKALTPTNRYRLMHALVHEVLVDEPNGDITATLVDFGAPLEAPDPPVDPTPEPRRPSLRLVAAEEAHP